MKEPYDLSEHSKTVDYMLEKTARENSKVAGQFKDEYFHLANTHKHTHTLHAQEEQKEEQKSAHELPDLQRKQGESL